MQHFSSMKETQHEHPTASITPKKNSSTHQNKLIKNTLEGDKNSTKK